MKSKAKIDAANRYGSYERGWKAAAVCKAMDPAFLAHDDKALRDAYITGYNDGYIARNTAFRDAAKRYRHKINVLRLV